MTVRCALAGTTTTAALLAAVGNPPVVDAPQSNGTALATTVTGFASWDVLDAPADVVGFAVLRLGLTIVLAGVLCGVAGRARSRPATWLAGWAAVIAASAMAGAAGYAYQVAVILDGRTVATSYADGLVLATNGGAAFGLWTGWVVGLVVAVVARTARAAVRPGAGNSGAQRVVVAAPPPWWAPTPSAADTGATALHPGPIADPPSGLDAGAMGVGEAEPPIFPSLSGSTHQMSTASGDPHPSDPGEADAPPTGDEDDTDLVDTSPDDAAGADAEAADRESSDRPG